IREKDSMPVTSECIYENSEIEDDLKKILIENKYQLSWIPYDEFTNIREI
ncbi:66_t:CDS:2, partial [Cetraspora pellucida]